MLKNPMQWIMIVLGSLIYSIGLNAFLIANHLAEGGFVGISVLLLYEFHLPVGATFFILNIPLLVLAWRIFGREFVLKTAVGVVGVSVFSELTKFIQVPTHDQLLAALYAGVVTGIGLGLIFRTGGTTGGADIIARILRHYRGMAMGKTLFTIDVVVICVVIIVIGKQVAMYSLVALFVSSRVIDFVIEGAQNGKALTIISDKHMEIVKEVHEQLERGTTLLQATGGYTGNDRQVVYCVVGREEVVRVQRIVHDVDPTAFVTISNVHEIAGEGFTFGDDPRRRRGFLRSR
ncbi:YitT family protein [Alicyclobacillus fastidiosus]|uniref:YitT family protein n=1 Tax=Alicyclobacillus fastidiosus TaxID=392011 RepID=A0ABY6ZAB1_9BACL|nr:YitT family protein [Alicyclobacillus fastidiosus]WAH39670.1 YitT family protein [Alicyclobacillus fastidiosus]GMA60881.1 membrane protein [Alicyclobacillus fastidiosus]